MPDISEMGVADSLASIDPRMTPDWFFRTAEATETCPDPSQQQQQLPHDVLKLVFSYMSTRTARTASLASKDFRHLGRLAAFSSCDSIVVSADKFCIRPKVHLLSEPTPFVRQPRVLHSMEIKLNDLDRDSDSFDTAEQILRVLSCCSACPITSLILHVSSKNDVWESCARYVRLLSCYSTVVELTLNSLTMPNHKLPPIVEVFPGVKRLNLRGFKVHAGHLDHSSTFPDIEEVHLNRCEIVQEVSHDPLDLDRDPFAHLKTLKTEDLAWFKHHAKLDELEALDWHAPIDSSRDEALLFLSNSKNLKSLRLVFDAANQRGKAHVLPSGGWGTLRRLAIHANTLLSEIDLTAITHMHIQVDLWNNKLQISLPQGLQELCAPYYTLKAAIGCRSLKVLSFCPGQFFWEGHQPGQVDPRDPSLGVGSEFDHARLIAAVATGSFSELRSVSSHAGDRMPHVSLGRDWGSLFPKSNSFQRPLIAKSIKKGAKADDQYCIWVGQFFAALAAMPSCVIEHVSHTPLLSGDHGVLSALALMPLLRTVRLAAMRLSTDDVAALVELPHMRKIELIDCAITGDRSGRSQWVSTTGHAVEVLVIPAGKNVKIR